PAASRPADEDGAEAERAQADDDPPAGHVREETHHEPGIRTQPGNRDGPGREVERHDVEREQDAAAPGDHGVPSPRFGRFAGRRPTPAVHGARGTVTAAEGSMRPKRRLRAWRYSRQPLLGIGSAF